MEELLKKSQPAQDKGWLPFGSKEQVEEGGPGREEHTFCHFCILPDMSHAGEENSHGRAKDKEYQWQKEVQVSMDLKVRLGKCFCGHGRRRRTEIRQGWEDYTGPKEEDL